MNSPLTETDKHYVVGINSVNHALEKGIAIEQLFIDSKKVSKRLIELLVMAEKRKISVAKVDKLKLDLMVVGSKHQGVVAVLGKSSSATPTLEDILVKENPLILLLDGVQDPHNLGACLRSAAAANVDAVILPKNRSAGITPTVSKVASGGAEMLPIFIETNLSRTVEKLKQYGLWSIALTGHTTQSLYKTDLRQVSVIIMGNEEKGISQNLLQHADFVAKIPMIGDIESLNVSVATGVVLFEALRQRGQ
ncbi:MAG: 23S rRNA (guanosine(2251)-2'-O)-methyltransferase RlmB [Ostreibacterium sp.]